MLLDLLVNSLLDFPFYALLALSFLVSFRIHNFPDLAMDASYALGMALLVAVTKSEIAELPFTISIPIALSGGFAVGALTASLYGLPWPRLGKLLAGLVVSFAMFSVNFRVNLGATTNGLYGSKHELNALRESLIASSPLAPRIAILLFLLAFLAIIFTVVAILLRSSLGVQLRVAGHRPNLLVEAGSRPVVFSVVALGLGNAIACLSGCIRAAADNYSDINTFGTFLFALASLMLGERVVGLSKWARRHFHTLTVQLLAPLVGGFLMSILIQLSILLLSSSLNVYLSYDIRMVMAIILVLTAANPGSRTALRGTFGE